MMENGHGMRERYLTGVEEQEAASKHPSFTPSPSSSSSSPCWTAPAEPAPAHLVEREHMFNKVVTPSDVGKLNRLVIPKQHAQRYFPLDPATGDKDLLLCFEESDTGKPWRFRYSYWNSSQSYVMTKGWSRFVKEKRLDAGDTVSFARGIGDSGRGRLFIDWIRQPQDPHRSTAHTVMAPLRSIVVPWAGGAPFMPPPVTMYGGSSSGGNGGHYLCFRSQAQGMVQLGGGGHGLVGLPMVLDSVPVVLGKAERKHVRLFGVNLECSEPEEDHQGVLQPNLPPNPHHWRLGPPRSEFRSSMEFKGNQEH